MPLPPGGGRLVHALGGAQNGGPFQGVEAYDPGSDSWVARDAMSAARMWHAAGVVGGKIIVCGGRTTVNAYFDGGTDFSETFSTLYIYNPSTDTSRKGPGKPTAQVNHTAAVVGGVLYVAGGGDYPGTQADTLYAYRPK